jgi:hypothetical protein
MLLPTRTRARIPHRATDLHAGLGGLALALCLLATPALSQQRLGYLENPLDYAYDSGISVVSGFHCTAQTIEIQFDQYDPIPAATGTPRGDTQNYCGRSDTGFSLLWNWNILGPGQHTVRALADGVEFDSATMTVSTFGEEFVWGLVLDTDITAYSVGKEIQLRWQESKQGFVISGIEDADYGLPEIMAAISGTWSGSWHSPLGGGTISIEVVEGMTGFPYIQDFTLTGTGCGTSGWGDHDIMNLDDPLAVINMSDGSRLELELYATESFTTVGGTFYFEDGPCADSDGMFYTFK